MAGALHFEIETARKGAGQCPRRGAGRRRIALGQRVPDFAAGKSRQRDQAVGAVAEPFALQLGAAAMLVPAMRAGQPVRESQIARARLAEQQKPLRRITLAFVRDPDVATDDRLDAPRARRLVELDHPEHVGQIGQRKRRHAIRRGRVYRLVDAHHAVDDRILAVHAQMDEQRGDCGHAHEVQFYSLPLATPMIATWQIPAHRALVALAIAVVLAACAAVPPTLPGEQAAPPAGPGTEPSVPAKPQAPPTRNPNPPANVNLQGFPLPYRQGYADGCASIGSVEHKDPVRFKGDGQYRTGWQDGNFLCKKK